MSWLYGSLLVRLYHDDALLATRPARFYATTESATCVQVAARDPVVFSCVVGEVTGARVYDTATGLEVPLKMAGGFPVMARGATITLEDVAFRLYAARPDAPAPTTRLRKDDA